nr:MAG TPA: hypothetical protein [Caudoviricetes sp.]
MHSTGSSSLSNHQQLIHTYQTQPKPIQPIQPIHKTPRDKPNQPNLIH